MVATESWRYDLSVVDDHGEEITIHVLASTWMLAERDEAHDDAGLFKDMLKITAFRDAKTNTVCQIHASSKRPLGGSIIWYQKPAYSPTDDIQRILKLAEKASVRALLVSGQLGLLTDLSQTTLPVLVVLESPSCEAFFRHLYGRGYVRVKLQPTLEDRQAAQNEECKSKSRGETRASYDLVNPVLTQNTSKQATIVSLTDPDVKGHVQALEDSKENRSKHESSSLTVRASLAPSPEQKASYSETHGLFLSSSKDCLSNGGHNSPSTQDECAEVPHNKKVNKSKKNEAEKVSPAVSYEMSTSQNASKDISLASNKQGTHGIHSVPEIQREAPNASGRIRHPLEGAPSSLCDIKPVVMLNSVVSDSPNDGDKLVVHRAKPGPGTSLQTGKAPCIAGDREVTDRKEGDSRRWWGFFWNLLGRGTLTDVLKDGKGWTKDGDYRQYFAMMAKLEEIARSRHRDEGLKDIANELVFFMAGKRCHLAQLTFASKVFLLDDQYKLLATRILDQLNFFELDDLSVELNQFNRMALHKFMAKEIFHGFFSKIVPDVESYTSSDAQAGSLLVFVFGMWNRCGLFRRSNVDWWGIRTPKFAFFYNSHIRGLLEALGKEQQFKLGFLICESPGHLLAFLIARLREANRQQIYLSTFDAEDVVNRLERIEASIDRDPEYSMGELKKFAKILQLIHFPNYGASDARARILEAVVQIASFDKRKSFCFYSALMELFPPEHVDHERLKLTIEHRFQEDLFENQSFLEYDSFLSLLRSDSGKLLTSGHGKAPAIEQFAKRTVSRKCTLREKVVFVSSLYGILCDQGFLRAPGDLVRELMILILEGYDSKPLQWRDLFGVANDVPDIFRSCPESLQRALAVVALSEMDGWILIEDPILASDLYGCSEKNVQSPFSLALETRLEEVAFKAASDLRNAALFYSRSCIDTQDLDNRLKCFAERVFVDAFAKWNPQSIFDVTSMESNTIQSVFRCLKHSSGALNLISGVVANLARTWRISFDADSHSVNVLKRAIIEAEKENWTKLGQFVGTPLPTKTDIAKKLDEATNMTSEIVSLLSAQRGSGQRLHDVFRGYNCHPSDRTAVKGLLQHYRAFLPGDGGSLAHLAPDENSRELRSIREDLDRCRAFWASYESIITTCDYFLRRPSVIFRKFMSEFTKVKMDVDDLSEALHDTLKRIADLFGPRTTFANVDNAVKVVTNAGVSVNQELETLTGWTDLKLTSEAQERFRTIARMSRLSGPLGRFVKFCLQFHFAVTRADPKFKELEGEVAKLTSGDLLDYDTCACIDFSTRLVNIICPRKDVDSILPFVTLVGAFSAHSEVWGFVREMNWVGDDGLKRFYEEYGNVTNVLLGNTAFYEMSVLNALEPVVRAISYIGSLEAEKSLDGLLSAIAKFPTLLAVSTNGSFSDLDEVQSSLSHVRDWFANGMDEITAAFAVFEAVCETGNYQINREDSGLLVLQLTYQCSGARKSIQGADLTRFIHHVGLVQHDDEQVLDKIGLFVEQHSIISSAAEDMIRLAHQGVEADLAQFQCCAGGQHLSDARHLLRASDDASFDFKTKMRHFREVYPVAFLFTLEELRQISALLEGGPDSPGWRDIAYCTCRLFPSGGAAIAFQERLSLCEETLSLVRQNGSTIWLFSTMAFVHKLHASLRNPVLPVRRGGHSQIVLHTMSFDASTIENAMFDLQRCIFKNRLPYEFEVLDVRETCTSDHLELFLQRALIFTDNIFVILNVDQLSGQQMEILLSFLSRHDMSTSGIQLHCIQRKSSLLHTGPTIGGKTWDAESLVMECEKAELSCADWKALVVDNISLNGVDIVWTPKSGSGKSHFIQKRLSEATREFPKCMSAKVTVHEQSSVTSIIADLVHKFSPDAEKAAVCFSFVYMPDQSEGSSLWLESMGRLFFSILFLRSVNDTGSGQSFHLGDRHWTILVEFPSQVDTLYPWLTANIPALAFCGTIMSPSIDFDVDDETRRVCTYLRALRDGTINRKFDAAPQRQIIFVLDWSGSMHHAKMTCGSSALSVATDNALALFDSHVQVGDAFGVFMFDHYTVNVVPLQAVLSEDHKQELRSHLNEVRNGGGGYTSMFRALLQTLDAVEVRNWDTWIICLTDGVSDDYSKNDFRERLVRTSEKLRLIIIGVNLSAEYETEMHRICGKYQHSDTGFFVQSSATKDALDGAFAYVSRRIPVSQTFELYDGTVSDSECRQLLQQYTQSFIDPEDLLMQSFWIRFLNRRVNVFDRNSEFNENVKHDNLGSTLMETMLDEIKRLLSANQSLDWGTRNHAQLIYDFCEPDNPQFRLICTSPDELDKDLRRKFEALDLPKFRIPTTDELSKRSTLDRFLSQSLGIPLQQCENGVGYLKCIDEHGFILTLDFTMKILSIHERVACGIPCLMEGETGVSKTALTRMYALLRNSSMKVEADASILNDISAIEAELLRRGYAAGTGENSFARLEDALSVAAQKSIGDQTEIAGDLHTLLMQKSRERLAIFRSTPAEFDLEEDSRTESASNFLRWFAGGDTETTFFDINVDSSQPPEYFVNEFRKIRRVAQKLGPNILVVVFLDEINTSSVLGLLKEVVVDHSLMGEDLEKNIAVIAACNPSRQHATSKLQSARERDQRKEWVSGHYQVAALPKSLDKVKWAYGSLTSEQEKEFIFRRMERPAGHTVSLPIRMALTEVIATSHEAMRKFAYQNILETSFSLDVDDQNGFLISSDSEGAKVRQQEDATARAKSVVSLRDIQRVFALYEFFTNDFNILCSAGPRDYMMLAVGVVYYMRLDSGSRHKFNKLIEQLPMQGREKTIEEILSCAMNAVLINTDIPNGIALTEGLRENVFMTMTCCLSRTPLLIVGPPGTSKTLAVNVTSDNANGEDSPSEFYRKYARLSLFHYQCSKESTSKEIAAVFEKAIQRQRKSDQRKHLSFVFMDEAGLPEEERESLKVLHYLLEGHMSIKAQVGFVAISNHVLDAAKSNRCVMLLRQEPDDTEMKTIVQGVLFGPRSIEEVEIDDEHHDAHDFASLLCTSYNQLQQHKWFESFFGLRDFIYFLKSLASLGSIEMLKLSISKRVLVLSIERNFNGVLPDQLRKIAQAFLQPLARREKTALIRELVHSLDDPLQVIRGTLIAAASVSDFSMRPRYKLIIDKTEDDSIMRLMAAGGVIDLSQRNLYKLSRLPEDVSTERMRLVSEVKYAALQGRLAVLSQSEDVHEALYDLLNQRPRVVAGRLYANIAIGGISRRCLIRPSFECIVHIRASQLHEMPAPFLNRFEKYTLGTEEVLEAGYQKLGGVADIFRKARERASTLIGILNKRKALFGWVDQQSLDSVFIDMLPHRAPTVNHATDGKNDLGGTCFAECLVEYIASVTSLKLSLDEVSSEISDAMKCMPPVMVEVLQQMTCGRELDRNSVMTNLWSLTTDRVRGALAAMNAALIQMILTKNAVGQMIQVASPEAIYMEAGSLPYQIVEQYFSQEHFSLRRIIFASKDTKGIGKLIIHTRTDASIIGLPTHPISHHAGASVPENRQLIEMLVHSNADEVVVQHLALLRSEAAVRGTVDLWMKDAKQRIFVLIVDACGARALEHTNYVRMFVEQRFTNAMSGKLFVLLLHSSPSATNERSCYPALFLHGWKHILVDGIGSTGPSLGVEDCIKSSCRALAGVDELSGLDAHISLSLMELIPRAAYHLGTQPLHAIQSTGTDIGDSHSFASRCSQYKALLTRKINKESIGSILCQSFAKVWLQTALPRIMKRSAGNLLEGRTHLPLSISIRSTLIDTFDAFLASLVGDMSLRENLRIIDSSEEIQLNSIFALVLRGLPVPPLEELLLRRNLRRATSPTRPTWQFPFFPYISSYIEDLVELTLQELVLSEACPSGESAHREIKLALQRHFLDSTAGGLHDSCTAQKRALLADVIQFVKVRQSRSGSLLDLYLYDFVAAKTGTQDSKCASAWMANALSANDSDIDLIDIHIVAKLKEKEFLSVASWGSSPFMGFQDGAQITEQYRADLLGHLLDRFETLLGSEAVTKDYWSLSFGRFLRQIEALRCGEALDESSQIRLRILSFFYIILVGQLSQTDESAALDFWYDPLRRKLQDTSGEGKLYLAALFRMINVHEPSSKNALHISIRYFFSRCWLNISTAFRDSDFLDLLDAVSANDWIETHTASSILEYACSSFRAEGRDNLIVGLPEGPLQVIGKRLLNCLSPDAASGGNERSMIHFIPDWLERSGGDDARIKADQFGGFFTDYKHCFAGLLPAAVFAMMMRCVAEEHSGRSSEDLLLCILHHIGNATSITGSSELHIAPDSVLLSMILDAETTCYVASVATDLGSRSASSVLCGMYATAGRDFLGHCMTTRSCAWDSFFFHTLMRVGGESILPEILGSDGPFAGLSWCEHWADGLLQTKNDLVGDLRIAENALRDALGDEERKSREIRHCPHCNEQFMVFAANCGVFNCGLDAHATLAAPVIGGVRVQGGYGCGREFQVNQARQYIVDEGRLQPLRIRVEASVALIRRQESGNCLWRQAREMRVPFVQFAIEKLGIGECFVKTAYFSNQRMDDPASPVSLVCGLQGSFDFLLVQRFLPDMIELYLWLQSTFRYIITKSQAVELRMKELMTTEKLHVRFDRDQTMHIMKLWTRVTQGVSAFLEQTDCKIQWECEEITVPFQNLDDAPLICLLSEGDGPSDGNDYLFLIICYMIDRYNTFVRRLEIFEGDKKGSGAASLIHPKFIVAGSSGAVAISSTVALSKRELIQLLGQSWVASEQKFNIEWLNTMLRQELVLHVPRPAIMNPIKHLREKFVFREDNRLETSELGTSSKALLSSDGKVFANAQDAHLCDAVAALLGGCVSDSHIRRTLEDAFHNLDYDELRAVLEGVRGTLQLRETEGYGNSGAVQDVVCKVYEFSSKQLDSEYKLVLEGLGFPSLSLPQAQLLFSLQPEQVVELTHFIADQLGSEAYLFARLPLALKEPLVEASREAFRTKLMEQLRCEGHDRFIASLDAFSQDILSFYETLICNEAQSSQNLRVFLLKNNCCDETDIIFACLPSDMTLRNYVSVRCLLHQMKLSLLFQQDKGTTTVGMAADDSQSNLFSSENNLVAERTCWLWTPSDRTSADEHDTVKRRTDREDVLWFVRQPKWSDPKMNELDADLDIVSDLEPSILPLPQLDSTVAATRIQRWCRAHFAVPIDMEMEDSYVNDFDGDEVFQHREEKVEDPEIDMSNYASKDMDLESSSSFGGSSRLEGRFWNYETLYGVQGAEGNGLYGEEHDEREMRRWLNDHKLPQLVGDKLLLMGVRSVEDIILLVTESEELLENDFSVMDRIKLKKAILPKEPRHPSGAESS